ncbi:GtrA family protein [Devosia algicola]|uniref:GtrA family protein n=1 Tax=Devosia algicola TaxID=3026418 RepID=A0ABY7YML8_9HYPH|nr:GtrA family protein [Devosia algicola]WDR02447.1 GtrA family protein [Devosia algicola]
MKRVLPFGLAGIAGFFMDASVLMAIVDAIGPFWARVVSFAFAVLTTWLINRNFAFSDCAAEADGMGREFARYFAAMIPGSLVNWLVYGAMMLQLPSDGGFPLLAVAMGSIAGMATNLAMAQRFAFTARR